MTLATEPFVSKPINAAEEPHAPRWTKAEYLRMVESGIFAEGNRRVFLFRGELIEMPPMANPHALGIQRSSKWAYQSLGSRFEIRIQLPLDTPGASMPEPDVCVLEAADSLRKPHPNRAVLLIEVADSSLKLDREKAHEYAVDAREYWILDVKRRVLHAYRNPHADPAGLFGWMFDAPTTFAEHETIAPVCEPDAAVAVRDLLPPA